MKRYFSGITAQQAPSPRSARQAFASFPETIQIAFQKPHCARLTPAFTSNKISSRLMIVWGIDENRLARSQAITRPLAVLRDRGRPNGSGFSGTSVIEVMGSALHQRDARVVPVHEEADTEADGQKHRHDERDGF